MSGTRMSALLAVAAAIAAAIALNLYAVRHGFRLDLTERGVFSLSPETERALHSLDRPAGVVFFYDERSRQMADLRELLERYGAASRWLEVASVDPILQPGAAARYAAAFPETPILAGHAIFSSGDRRFMESASSEEAFTNGILRASRGAGARICFSSGHAENDPFSFESHDHFESELGHDHHGGAARRVVERHGLGDARRALEILGYSVETRVTARGPEALEGCQVLVVASPQSAFAKDESTVVRAFLAAGGNALFLLETGRGGGLEALLADYGIEAPGGRVADPIHHYWTDPYTPAVATYPRHRITRGLPLTFFPGAAPLRPVGEGSPPDVVVTPLVLTSAEATLASGSPGPHALMVYAIKTVRRGEEDARVSRVAVVGDGDFATNSFFSAMGNRDLFLNTVHVLSSADHYVGIAPRTYVSPSLELTGRQMWGSFFVATVAMPALLLGAGLVVSLRRRFG